MTEFKIGDKVRVLVGAQLSLYQHCFRAGEVGEVIGLQDDFEGLVDVEVEVEGIKQVVHPSELELVNE